MLPPHRVAGDGRDKRLRCLAADLATLVTPAVAPSVREIHVCVSACVRVFQKCANPWRRGSVPGLWCILGGSQRLVLPQHDQAEALQEPLHPQTVSQEQQHRAGPGQAVNVDHRALLGQEALGQGVTVHRHRQLRHGEQGSRAAVSYTTCTVLQQQRSNREFSPCPCQPGPTRTSSQSGFLTCPGGGTPGRTEDPAGFKGGGGRTGLTTPAFI